MPFQPIHLPAEMEKSLSIFLQRQDFVTLYKSYRWKRDTYSNAFPDIAELEGTFKTGAMKNELTIQNLISVAKWGGLRNISRIKATRSSIAINLYGNDKRPLSQLGENPLLPLTSLQRQVKGLGPTYLSKAIRFSLPEEYGAIDTRIVRVFGQGDRCSRQQDWLELKARNNGYGWYIPKAQPSWPSGYAKWLNILRFFWWVLCLEIACFGGGQEPVCP